MAAYVIVEIDVTDPVGYEEYRQAAQAAIGIYGGKYLVRGGASETLEGDWVPQRLVVLEFADAEAARRWWNSPEYEAAKLLRRRSSSSRFVLVEGYNPA
jgi:uncharacterized protein (DUF1330 family)